MPVVRLARTIHFSAGHSYRSHELSEAENKKVYGDLYQEKGFGHNFKLEVHFQGEIDPQTGMIENLAVIDQWLKVVTNRLDHRYFNDHVPEFKNKPATAENIAAFCFTLIETAMGTSPRVKLIKTRLYEGDSTWVDVYASELTQKERDF